MNIKNQKNGSRVQIIHQESLVNIKPCPVKTLMERVHHILSNGETKNACISVVYTNITKVGIHTLHISLKVKASVCALGLEKQGIMEHMVDTQSFRDGGAMALNVESL